MSHLIPKTINFRFKPHFLVTIIGFRLSLAGVDSKPEYCRMIYYGFFFYTYMNIKTLSSKNICSLTYRNLYEHVTGTKSLLNGIFINDCTIFSALLPPYQIILDNLWRSHFKLHQGTIYQYDIFIIIYLTCATYLVTYLLIMNT